jgi:hypothetical protein
VRYYESRKCLFLRDFRTLGSANSLESDDRRDSMCLSFMVSTVEDVDGYLIDGSYH